MFNNSPTLVSLLFSGVVILSGCQTGSPKFETGLTRSVDLCDEKLHESHERYSADFTGDGKADLLVWGEKVIEGCILLPEANWHITLNDYPTRMVGEFFQIETQTNTMADILSVDPNTGKNRLFITQSKGGNLSFHGRSINPKVFKKIGESRVSLFQGELNHDPRGILEVIAWWKPSGELRIISFQQPHEQESTLCLIDEHLIRQGLDLIVRDFNGDGRDDLRFWIKDSEGNMVVRTFNTFLTHEQQYRFMDEQGHYYEPHECRKSS